MYDVAVVGGGPSGACAAQKLAEAGAAVVLLEKKSLPRYKTCGGGVVQRARSLLDIDIGSVVEREFNSTTVTLLSSNLSFTVRRDRPLIYMTMRSDLDGLLVSAAEKSGARIRPETKVRSFSPHKTHIELDTSAGAITARIVIAADGANSLIARQAGWRSSRLLVPAVESELYLSDKEMARLEDVARFDFDIPSRGYAWLFPKKDHLSAGALSFRRRNPKLKQAFEHYLHTLGIKKVEREQRRGFMIPAAPRVEGFTGNRVILVGDAAGFADPVTCEGISSAIKSGQLAAASLIRSSLEWSRCQSTYERLVKKQILPGLSIARFLSSVLYAAPNLRTMVFSRFGILMMDVLAGVFAGEDNYIRALTTPKNYLSLLKSGRHG